MFDKSHIKHTKSKALVQIRTSTGRSVVGEVFLAQGERLVDLLNDTRHFLPLMQVDGTVKVVSKSSISEASIIAKEPDEKRNPYAVLKVQRGASAAEIKAAWMKRLKMTHPDRLAALDMDEDVQYAARRACQKVNQAYDEIMRDLRDTRRQEAVRELNV
jgi:DnaJ-like protein/uncharacterized protein DUF6812